jgi:hypothetical protein
MSHRLICIGLLLTFGALVPATLVYSDDSTNADALTQQNQLLRERVDKLESELSQVKALLTEKGVTPADKKPAGSGMKFELYGYVKVDSAYDNSRTSIGNFARWAESESVRPDDDQFSMTANQTRLGLQITAPDLPNMKTFGKIEIDFYGAGVSENKPEPLLRHAFVNVIWPNWQLGFLAGQTSDIISPLTPATINYTVGWWQGNIGYRRPQLRLTKEFDFSKDVGLKLEVGATRTITGRRFLLTDPIDPDSGTDAGIPTVQGRTSVSFPIGEKRRATFGVSGHWGTEEQHLDLISADRSITSWSANLDLSLPLAKWLTLQAEGFIGSNLDSYLGGAGQGFDPATAQGIDASGGWIAASLGPWNKWQMNLGAGFDNPDDDDLTLAVSRTLNSVIFGNVWYAFSSNLSLGFEISHLHTEYKAVTEGNCLREQLAVMFKF